MLGNQIFERAQVAHVIDALAVGFPMASGNHPARIGRIGNRVGEIVPAQPGAIGVVQRIAFEGIVHPRHVNPQRADPHVEAVNQPRPLRREERPADVVVGPGLVAGAFEVAAKLLERMARLDPLVHRVSVVAADVDERIALPHRFLNARTGRVVQRDIHSQRRHLADGLGQPDVPLEPIAAEDFIHVRRQELELRILLGQSGESFHRLLDRAEEPFAGLFVGLVAGRIVFDESCRVLAAGADRQRPVKTVLAQQIQSADEAVERRRDPPIRQFVLDAQ